MTAFLLFNNEVDTIDSYRPQIDYTSPVVTQADNPERDRQALVAARLPELPSPSVGGEFGSRIRNGFSTGIRSLTNRTQPFSGAVAKPPAITNPVQGEVGMNNRQSKQYAGVMSQLTQYVASEASYAAAWVGNVNPARQAKEPGNNA